MAVTSSHSQSNVLRGSQCHEKGKKQRIFMCKKLQAANM